MKTRTQLLLALLSGVLVCASFPTLIAGVHLPEMGWLGWVALVPLILAVRRAAPRRAFLITFLAGCVWFGGSVFWVYNSMHVFGHLPELTSFLVLVLLVAILAAFIALAPMFARMIATRSSGELIVLLPVCWVAVEVLRNYVPCNGFPWSNIAMSQWRLLPFIQIADLVGIYGVTFLLVWVNAFLAELIAKLRGETVAHLVPKAVMTVILLAMTLAYGFWQLRAIPPTLAAFPSTTVGIVQGNIDQGAKWSREKARQHLDAHREKARRLAESDVELIVWPETAFPFPIGTDDTEIDPRALGLAEGGVGKVPYTLLGAVTETPDGNFYNSGILFDGNGKLAGEYHKAHLVPFGEYVPYRKLLFFARKLTQPVGNFLAGTSDEPLSAGSRKLGVLICYEDVFPEIARRQTRAGAELLVNLTNTAWFGATSAPLQHLAISVFRAVENRRFLVRATNTGVSAVVMPTGETTVESRLFEPALIVSPVALVDRLTLYTRLGDWFAWACVAYMGIGIAMVIVARIRGRKT